MKSKSKFTLLLAAAGLFAALAGAFTALRGPSAVPDVAFIGVKGEKYSLSSLRGKVVLVNFWATTCTVCKEEMPRMVQLFEKYQDRGFETVAVAMSYDPPDRVFAYARENKLPFRVALDIFGKVMDAFGGIRGTPTTFLMDKRGYVVRRFEGQPDFAMLGDLIETELAKG